MPSLDQVSQSNGNVEAILDSVGVGSLEVTMATSSLTDRSNNQTILFLRLVVREKHCLGNCWEPNG